MASFLLVKFDRLVLVTCGEWCNPKHSVVIRTHQARLKCEERSRARDLKPPQIAGPACVTELLGLASALSARLSVY